MILSTSAGGMASHCADSLMCGQEESNFMTQSIESFTQRNANCSLLAMYYQLSTNPYLLLREREKNKVKHLFLTSSETSKLSTCCVLVLLSHSSMGCFYAIIRKGNVRCRKGFLTNVPGHTISIGIVPTH